MGLNGQSTNKVYKVYKVLKVLKVILLRKFAL
jgi:hypothetical protein